MSELTREGVRLTMQTAQMDNPTEDQFEILRGLIARELINAQLMRDTLRVAKSNWKTRTIELKSYYFTDRQGITFESDGFIAFAGWADDGNVQPILRACVKWVEECTGYVE